MGTSTGFTSLLAQITKDDHLKDLADKQAKQARPAKVQNNKPPAPTRKTTQIRSDKRPMTMYSNPADPAVQRLKAARRKEKEKLEARKKPTKRPRQPRVAKKSIEPTPRRYGPSKHTVPKVAPPPRQQPAGPKLSFKELMNKASSIDKSSLEYNPIKIASKEPPKSKGLIRSKDIRTGRGRGRGPPGGLLGHHGSLGRCDPPNHRAPPNYRGPPDHYDVRGPHGPHGHRPGPSFAKPSKELAQKLMRRRHRENERSRRPVHVPEKRERTDEFDIEAASSDEEEDDGYGYYDEEDDDSFIVDDDEGAGQYNREEIWKMFNRDGMHRRESYDDDIDDNMEAAGSEILDEEEAALRQAKIDDRREARLLEEHRLEKLKRKKGL